MSAIIQKVLLLALPAAAPDKELLELELPLMAPAFILLLLLMVLILLVDDLQLDFEAERTARETCARRCIYKILIYC